MTESTSWLAQSSASTPRSGHACNCVGCCKRCGTCRTWHGHTRDYCDLLQRQAKERDSFPDRQGATG